MDKKRSKRSLVGMWGAAVACAVAGSSEAAVNRGNLDPFYTTMSQISVTGNTTTSSSVQSIAGGLFNQRQTSVTTSSAGGSLSANAQITTSLSFWYGGTTADAGASIQASMEYTNSGGATTSLVGLTSFSFQYSADVPAAWSSSLTIDVYRSGAKAATYTGSLAQNWAVESVLPNQFTWLVGTADWSNIEKLVLSLRVSGAGDYGAGSGMNLSDLNANGAPAPGVLGLLGAAGLARTRRRR